MCKPAVENSNEDPSPLAALLGMRQGTSTPQVSDGGCCSPASHRCGRETGIPRNARTLPWATLGDEFFFLK